MGNDVLRVVSGAVQKPWQDLMKYCCNACDSDCQSPCRSCHITTHEPGDESPDLIEKEIPVRQHAIHGGEQRSL